MPNYPSLFKAIALTIIAAIFVTSYPLGTARAALVSTEQVVDERSAASDRERLTQLFLRDDVRQQMEALGVDREEALARLASLSDQEVAQIADRIDELPAGQGVLGAIVVIAGVTFLVLLVTDLLGFTDIFGFINPIR